MKLGIMQPYFFPYIGYWQLISAVDTFIVYDDVTYIKGGWINRNNFLMNKERKLYSISLSGASSYKLINEININDNFIKFMKMLTTNYSKAPFFEQTYSLLEKITSFKDKNLAFFLHNSISLILQHLSINTKLLLSSDIKKNNELAGQDKILHICDILNAGTYINAIGGQNLYQREVFEKNNKELLFLKTDNISYPQFSESFISGLSIIDILMFNSIPDVKEHLAKYQLI